MIHVIRGSVMSDNNDDKKDDDHTDVVFAKGWSVLPDDSPLHELLNNTLVDGLKDAAERSFKTEDWWSPSKPLQNAEPNLEMHCEETGPEVTRWVNDWLELLGYNESTTEVSESIEICNFVMDEEMSKLVQKACHDSNQHFFYAGIKDTTIASEYLAKLLHKYTGFCWTVVYDESDGTYDLGVVAHMGNALTVTSPVIQ